MVCAIVGAGARAELLDEAAREDGAEHAQDDAYSYSYYYYYYYYY